MGWTDPAVVAGSTLTLAQHVTELRGGIAGAYVAAGLSAPSFSDSPLQAGATGIKALHITELRNAVKALESQVP